VILVKETDPLTTYSGVSPGPMARGTRPTPRGNAFPSDPPWIN
jgi:hypothetical protein